MVINDVASPPPPGDQHTMNSDSFRGNGQPDSGDNTLHLGNTCSKIDFLQINLHHCVAAMENLNSCFRNYKTEKIALIQEPYLARGKISGISKNLKTISGPGSRPRAGILF